MAALDIAANNPIDLAIVDLQMPDMNGLVTITKLKEVKPGLKTILLTGHGNDKVKQATESLNTLYFEKDEMEGFWNFIKKLNTDGKVVVIRPTSVSPGSPTDRDIPSSPYLPHEIEIRDHRGFAATDERAEGVSAHPNRSGDMDRPRIVGETPAMVELRKNIERMASLDCTVTLRGEPGSGKELAARAMHAGSLRKKHRFLAISCANLGSEQLAGQLLGYKGGDLSEAIRSRNGVFSADRVGTLLFKQVEKMPDDMQDQLLKILDMTDSQLSGGRKQTDYPNLVDTSKSPMYMGNRRCSIVKEKKKDLQPRI
jgi:DNA-binding NtrC family response regulator